jgi:hypothetical protein
MINKGTSRSRILSQTGLAAFLILGAPVGENLLHSSRAEGGWVYVKESPKLVVSPLPIPYQRKTAVTIAGSGFEPKQEVSLHIELGGVPSEISFMVKPRPVANEFGAFSTEWILDNEIRTKLLSPTAYTLRAEDENGSVLAHAPVVFVPEKKKEEKAKTGAKKDEPKKAEVKK